MYDKLNAWKTGDRGAYAINIGSTRSIGLVEEVKLQEHVTTPDGL